MATNKDCFLSVLSPLICGSSHLEPTQQEVSNLVYKSNIYLINIRITLVGEDWTNANSAVTLSQLTVLAIIPIDYEAEAYNM